MKIDLSQFRQTYLQESAEHVEAMETGLLALRSDPSDVETLNAIFRAAHSIKGGAGSFGLTHLMQFTHALESLLDPLRAFEIPATTAVISQLLQSVDMVRAMLKLDVDAAMPEQAVALIRQFESMLTPGRENKEAQPPDHTEEGASQCLLAPGGAAHELTLYRVDFRPLREIFSNGTNPIVLLRNLAALGTVSVCQMHLDDLPPIGELDASQCYLRWTLELACAHPEETVREVFEFVEHLAEIKVDRLLPPTHTGHELAVRLSILPDRPGPVEPGTDDRRTIERRVENQPRRRLDSRRAPKKIVTATETSSIRVATDKVDRLIDLVGELMIAQVMTAQMIENFETSRLPKLREAMHAMERSTRELHERVMAVRMMPIGSLFQRYSRVLYDIAQSTGKQIRLETDGEETEIDKSMLELLGDPLTHLVRNAADHGIELPAERAAAGKPQEGVIHMRAFHRAGRIVIEISDDGAGIDTARVRAKAVDRGLIHAETQLSEDQLRMLIFEPGFSTRETVTDLSGRGVGMDVVKRNVQQLSGSVSLESALGKGSTVSIELPLTLAILEGLLVRVADRTLVVPLLAVVEAVSPRMNPIQRLAEQGEVILIRGESIPVVRLRRFLELEELEARDTETADSRLVVIVEAGRKKIGLAVDELLGQQQVVVKSLEKHLHKVEGLMGATILGDGRVAPILDVTVLTELNLFSLRPQAKKTLRHGLPAPSPAPGPAMRTLQSTRP